MSTSITQHAFKTNKVDNFIDRLLTNVMCCSCCNTATTTMSFLNVTKTLDEIYRKRHKLA